MQYQLLPPLDAAEYAALKSDIAERGVQVPIEYDEAGNVLDGHHRLQICGELGITQWPSVVRAGMTEEAKAEHVLALNLARRHLSREQRQELVATLRQRGWSYPRIAKWLGIGVMTAYRDSRAGLPNDKPALLLPTITGADGKQYPARRPVEFLSNPATWQLDYSERAAAQAPTNQPVVFPEPAEPPRPHVANNSGENEWYTPPEYIEAARHVMGGIDLDPASTAVANAVVGAARYYTAQDDGLRQRWQGTVWMNPPYAQPLITEFCDKLCHHLADGSVPETCVLVNNATETAWFQGLAAHAAAICFPKGRVRFWAPARESATPLQGQAVLYAGPNAERFVEIFRPLGLVVRL